MKRKIFLILFIPIFSYAQKMQEKTIKWQTGLTWSQIKQKAKKEDKYIFLDLYATWCAPCKAMDAEVYTDENIIKITSDKFISVKLQMDSTQNDNEEIKRWYKDAEKIGREYVIQGYPSFLFFTPEGLLAYKDIGFKNVRSFSQILSKALNPMNPVNYSRLSAYREGKKDYSTMDILAIFVKQTLSDKKLANEVASDYKRNVISKMKERNSVTKPLLDFISEYPSLVESNDIVFRFAYEEPQWLDSVFTKVGFADYLVKQTITREELVSNLEKDGKRLVKKPDWTELKKKIDKKYVRYNADTLLLDYQVAFYRRYEDWIEWAKYKERKLNLVPPKADGLQAYIQLNTYGAWDAFKNCNDKIVLRKTLAWIDLALNIDKKNAAAYSDTKANVLYKLGEISSAIECEKAAIDLDPKNSKFKEVLSQMVNGKPTYVDQGANWDLKLLPIPKN